MSDNLFVSLDRLLLEFVFQYEQDISTKEDMIQRITKCFEGIKENKASICKIHETINQTDEEIAHYYKHSKEIKDNCSNWKPTCDVFHKHEDYMQDQLTAYQETVEKDKKMYHGHICQYKDVLKQYQLKYSETHFSFEYYEKKKQHDEIKNRVLACTEQLKLNETILMEFLVQAESPDRRSSQLHRHNGHNGHNGQRKEKLVNLRCKTQDILKCANNFARSSFELKKEANDMEIEISYLNKQIAKLYETKNLSGALEEKNKSTEKKKELKERIFEKDEHVLVSNRAHQSSQLFLPYESQKFARAIKMHSSEPRITDEKEENSRNQSKSANSDFSQKENEAQIFNDSGASSNSKYSCITAVKSSQDFVQFRSKQSNYDKWIEKGHSDADCGDKGIVRRLRESKCTPQAICIESFGKSVESDSGEVEERTENFPQTPETPLFLRNPDAVKTPESLDKIQFLKSPLFESRNRNVTPDDQKQKDSSPGFSFLMSYTSRSPGLNLFDSSASDPETSSDQFNEHYSTVNLNRPSSQEIGNLFGKAGEDAFAFSFPSGSSTQTFEAGKDDFSFPFSFEQDQNAISSSSLKDLSSSKNKMKFPFF